MRNTSKPAVTTREPLRSQLLTLLLAPTLLSAVIWFAAWRGSFLLAHTLAELFSIVVAANTLAVATAAHKFTRNHFVVFVSVAIGWAAGLDLIHTLIYEGMHLMPDSGTNRSAQMWVTARLIQAVALMVSPLMLSRHVPVGWLHLGFGAVNGLAVLAFFAGWLPDAFVEGKGLTPLKIALEYVIIGLLAVALALLWWRRRLTTPRLLWGMSGALVTMMMAEFAFTQYASAYGGANLFGHILKVFAYWFVWVALVQTNLKDPFSLLSRAASTYDAVPDPTLIVLANGNIQQANRAAGQVVNLEASSLVGRSSHELFHDPRLPQADCPVCSRLGRGAAFTQMLSLPGERFVECSVTPFAHATEHHASVEVVRDITEQHASEERFRKLFEDARQATVLLDDGRAVAANRAAVDMLRLDSMDQIIGHTPADFAPLRQPNGRLSSELAPEYLAEALSKGSLDFDWEMSRADGDPLSTHVMLTSIRMGGRQMVHSIWRDITQERRALQELAESRQSLELRVQERTAELAAMTEALNRINAERQAVFDAANVGIVLKRDQVIQRTNRTMERLFGYGPDELIGKTTRVLYPDDATYEEASQRLLSSLADTGFFVEEREMVRKDGSRFWCRKTDEAIDRNDLSRGVAGTFEDTSTEHDAMAEMARARAMAEDLARTKSEFLANMSHEIRTPMNSVIGMTHLALKAEPPPRVRDYLEKIQAAGRHLLSVINDILDFSKLEARKMALDCADFSLDKVMEDVSSLLSARAADKGLELVVDVSPQIPVNLMGDPLRIEQVLINLTSNAVKFTDRGHITISVQEQARQGDEIVLRFEVADTGIGVAPEQAARLFQSFQQGDASTTRKYGGSGLGLIISKRLAELMGGEIGMRSEPGVGSTFWFTTRLKLNAQLAPRRPLCADLAGLRTLLVDDDAEARQVIGRIASSEGLQPTAVTSGAQALQALEAAVAQGQPYQLVLLDWRMPQMSGLELAREIQRRELGHPSMILMIAGFGRDDAVDEARGLGIRELLVKPVTASALCRSLRRELGKDDAAEPPAAQAMTPMHLLGARALVVEDNEFNQQVAVEFLQALGLVVEVADNGAVGVERVRRGDYDVVLMDMLMPVMDGLDATRAIRKLPGREQLPILALTANAMADHRDRCIAAGMNDHIAKPIDPDDLRAKLTRWVKPGARRPAAAGVPSSAGEVPDEVPAADALAAQWNEVEGLDAQRGLRMAMGRVALYLQLLSRFVRGHRGDDARIAQAIAAGRWDEARRIAHTLKGVAGQIGAEPVRGVAQLLEQACVEPHNEALAQSALAQLAQLLGPLAAAIAQRLPAEAPSAAQAAVDLADWPRVRDTLQRLLQDDDAASLQYLQEHRDIARAGLGEHYQEVAGAVDNFDFSAALAKLNA